MSSQPLIPDTKTAYKNKDIESSKVAHDARQNHKQNEAHSQSSGYLKSFVFGALDGTVTCFAVVASVAGSNLAPVVVLVLGIANLVADALAMGFGDYLSEKAERDLVHAEYEKEKWETENYLQGEIEEMVELYMEKGMSEDDARSMLSVMSRYPKVFVDTMMMEELGMLPPDEDSLPWKNGIVMFLSFLLFGSIPLFAYILFPVDGTIRLLIASCCTVVTLFGLGYTKGALIGQKRIVTGMIMMVQGSLAAVAAYGIAVGIDKAAGVSDNCSA
eukprot:TRINITY_DN4903_c1_g1_i4.p1 TRINITY_DN4903_c1_g1~~TRINITY_DN4903_c1_g1_i4.p1  ORF type:complete len:297 (+),score=46.89 TRINITY_DN4903_c1_g1_i4:75-893(+)